MPDPAPVRLDTDLEVPVRGAFADWLDTEAGGVSVRADHGDGVAGGPSRPDGEGDEGGGVAGEVVFTSGRDGGGGPGGAFGDGVEACFLEEGGGGLDCVVG